MNVVLRRTPALAACALLALAAGCHGSASTSTPQPSTGPVSASDSICPPHPTWNPDSRSLMPVLLPSQPTATIPAKHLVPDADPAQVWLCQYEFNTQKRTATAKGVRRVEQNLGQVHGAFWAQKLADARPRSCTQIKTIDTGYLVELVYPDNTTVWLELPGHNQCLGTTNGTMTASDSPIEAADKAYATGSWPS